MSIWDECLSGLFQNVAVSVSPSLSHLFLLISFFIGHRRYWENHEDSPEACWSLRAQNDQSSRVSCSCEDLIKNQLKFPALWNTQFRFRPWERQRKTLSPLLSISCTTCRSWHCMIPIFSQVARKKNPTHHTTSSRLYVPVVTFPTFMNHRHVPTSLAAFAFCLLFQTWALRYRTDLWLDMPWTTTSISETWM